MKYLHLVFYIVAFFFRADLHLKENSKSKTGFIIGLIAAVLILTTPNPESLPIEAQRAAAIFVWMAIWWATEAVHIAITAM